MGDWPQSNQTTQVQAPLIEEHESELEVCDSKLWVLSLGWEWLLVMNYTRI